MKKNLKELLKPTKRKMTIFIVLSFIFAIIFNYIAGPENFSIIEALFIGFIFVPMVYIGTYVLGGACYPDSRSFCFIEGALLLYFFIIYFISCLIERQIKSKPELSENRS